MEKEIKKIGKKKEMNAVVVSNKMVKTVKVEVDHVVREAAYGKVIKRVKTFLAHTEKDLNIGDKVVIRETKPFSKNVRWAVVNKE